MRQTNKILVAILLMVMGFALQASAQQDTLSQQKKVTFDENAPLMNSDETPRLYHIRKVNIHGVTQMSENNLRSIAGLIPGDTIYLPSSFISNSISRLWALRGRLFVVSDQISTSMLKMAHTHQTQVHTSLLR